MKGGREEALLLSLSLEDGLLHVIDGAVYSMTPLVSLKRMPLGLPGRSPGTATTAVTTTTAAAAATTVAAATTAAGTTIPSASSLGQMILTMQKERSLDTQRMFSVRESGEGGRV